MGGSENVLHSDFRGSHMEVHTVNNHLLSHLGSLWFFVHKLSSVEEQQEECSSEPALPQAHQAARPGRHASRAILI